MKPAAPGSLAARTATTSLPDRARRLRTCLGDGVLRAPAPHASALPGFLPAPLGAAGIRPTLPQLSSRGGLRGGRPGTRRASIGDSGETIPLPRPDHLTDHVPGGPDDARRGAGDLPLLAPALPSAGLRPAERAGLAAHDLLAAFSRSGCHGVRQGRSGRVGGGRVHRGSEPHAIPPADAFPACPHRVRGRRDVFLRAGRERLPLPRVLPLQRHPAVPHPAAPLVFREPDEPDRTVWRRPPR